LDVANEQLEFSEDQTIMERLTDPLDIEAFTNLIANAHDSGMSAVDFVREEPGRTSRRVIRKLCLKDKGRSLWVQISSSLKSLWSAPSGDTDHLHALYGSTPPSFGVTSRKGRNSGSNGKVTT
jgi:hypothetical protein